MTPKDQTGMVETAREDVLDPEILQVARDAEAACLDEEGFKDIAQDTRVGRFDQSTGVLAGYNAILLDRERRGAGTGAIASEAAFLLNRLRDFGNDGDAMTEDGARDWCGHVEPSIARLSVLLAEPADRGAGTVVPDGSETSRTPFIAGYLNDRYESGDRPSVEPPADRGLPDTAGFVMPVVPSFLADAAPPAPQSERVSAEEVARLRAALTPFAIAADRADADCAQLGQGEGFTYRDTVTIDPILPSGETPVLCLLGDFYAARAALGGTPIPLPAAPTDATGGQTGGQS